MQNSIMDTINPVTRDFVLYCVHRRGDEWPALYDEMCRVAGQRLFRGMSYSELSNLGLSLGLDRIEDTLRIVHAVTAQEC